MDDSKREWRHNVTISGLRTKERFSRFCVSLSIEFKNKSSDLRTSVCRVGRSTHTLPSANLKDVDNQIFTFSSESLLNNNIKQQRKHTVLLPAPAYYTFSKIAKGAHAPSCIRALVHDE